MSNIQLTGSKEDMLAIFREQVSAGKLSNTKHNPEYTGKRVDRRNTADGNPSYTWAQAHPHVGSTQVSGKMGLNGKIGGNGSYGD